MTLKSGDLIRNRYRIMHRLSDTSYRALDMSLRQSCLVKEFSGTTSERVTQLASLQHPRLPRVIDLAREGDQTLLVMDLVDGVSLSERVLQSNEPIPFETFRPWLIQLSETLEYLHQQTPPLAHGDVLIDNILVQPDGSTAFTDFSSYSRNPSEDIKGLGMITGYLATHTMPPVSADRMREILADRTDVMSQTALQMLNGEVKQLDANLRSQLTNTSSVRLVEAEPQPDEANSASESVSTTPLAGQAFGDVPELVDTPENDPSAQPVMPWDQDEEGSDTLLWGERSSEPISEKPSADVPKTTPFADPAPASSSSLNRPTEVLGSSPVSSGFLQEVDAQAPINPPSPNPISSGVETAGGQYESRFDGDEADESEKSGGFNWLWIIVGIMAGVILLCVACLGIGIYFADDLETEPTPAQFSNFTDEEEEPETDFQIPTQEVATEEAVDPDEFDPGLSGEELEPTSTVETTNQESTGGVNLPEPDLGDQEIIRNEAFGYQFVLPDQLVVAEEVDGSITLAAASGNDDIAIFLAVFAITPETTAASLMAELVLSAESEGGTVYGEAIPAQFSGRSDLTGQTVTINLPPAEGETASLLGQMYALENSDASVMIVSTAVPDQFQALTEQLNGLIESLEIFTPEN
ncbi:MAG: protein kinase [Anaerolineae bacterium]